MKTVFAAIVIGPGGISDALSGGKQVELRQEITRHYDDSNGIADSLFDGVGATYKETRVSWRAVPDGATTQEITDQLAKFPKARLMRILSHEIIMNDNQNRLYKNGFIGPNADKAFADFKTRTGVKSTVWDAECQKAYLAIVEDAQLVKAGENNTQDLKADEPVLYNGKKQYRVIAFSREGAEDIDLRNEKAVTESIDLAPVTAKEAVEA